MNIINNVSRYQIKVKNIETDSIIIVSNGGVLIDDCKANYIDPGFGRLTIKNSIAKTINLDLNRVRNWNIEDSEIETRNYTGSGRHNVTLHRNETGTINWLPKNEKAELNIKVPGNPTQIVLQ